MNKRIRLSVHQGATNKGALSVRPAPDGDPAKSTQETEDFYCVPQRITCPVVIEHHEDLLGFRRYPDRRAGEIFQLFNSPVDPALFHASLSTGFRMGKGSHVMKCVARRLNRPRSSYCMTSNTSSVGRKYWCARCSEAYDGTIPMLS